MDRRVGFLGLAVLAAAGAAAGRLVIPHGGAARPAPARLELVDGRELKVLAVHASPLAARGGDRVELTCEVRRGRDRRGALRFVWTAAEGGLQDADTARARWLAPGKAETFTIRLQVADDDGEAAGGIRISVRLPSDRDHALVAAARSEEAELDQQRIERQAAFDRQAAPLLEKARHRQTLPERQEAKSALEELGSLYQDAERHEAAYQTYRELRVNVLRNTEDYRKYSAAFGREAYLLGKDGEARTALEEAGPWRSSRDEYYYADLIERSGERNAAVDAYLHAWDRDIRYGEPLYRAALLEQRRGDPPERIVDLLVQASPRLDRDFMLERLSSDPELAEVYRLLLASGRTDELKHHMPFRWRPDGTREDITAEATP
jgi:hypothetical protein